MSKKKIVISGGNSGIGLEVGRQLAARGCHVILLGRDERKGQAAVESITKAGGAAEFLACDLSSHAGVRDAAEKLSATHAALDGLVLGAGVLTFKDRRTSDDLHEVFAVNYLSRYHLAQRLLPTLRAAAAPTIVLLVAGVSLKSKIDLAVFPRYQPFPGPRALSSIQIANYHYAAHLAKSEPWLKAAVVNVGLVKTDILRDMPVLGVLFKILGPLVTVSVARSAENAAQLTTTADWKSGTYWPKPGRLDKSTALQLDADVTEKAVSISRELTGA